MADAEPAVQVGILLGAGPRLSASTRAKLKQLMKDVFELAQQQLSTAEVRTELDLIDLAELLTKRLEDSPLTNAGRGSELTLSGTVECDATMGVCGERGEMFASCGAVPDLRNPIALCAALLRQQLDWRPRRRSVPNFLVGGGAREYGLRLGLCRGNDATPRAEETRQKYMTKNDAADLDRYGDTVGLILVCGPLICVCSSSGGPILKDAGRVGPAALYGCGAFAAAGYAAVCSGFGEDISATRLAQRAAAEIDTDLADVLKGPWSQRLQYNEPYFGVLRALVTDQGVAFEWQHTTEGMVCGFARVSRAHVDHHHLVCSTEPQGGGVRV